MYLFYVNLFCFFLILFLLGTEHTREDKADLYYWDEITGQHTRTSNIEQIPKPLMITGHVIINYINETRMSVCLSVCVSFFYGN